jgi:NhaP-type Na+/H+ or K+/H+ antiporter
VVLLARPLVVWLATLGSNYSWQQKALIAWVAPRGIVAAAVSSLFALRLEETGHEGASALVALTFLVIIATVLLQSVSARKVTRALGLAEAEPNGMLFVGANPVARALGVALQGPRISRQARRHLLRGDPRGAHGGPGGVLRRPRFHRTRSSSWNWWASAASSPSAGARAGTRWPA